MNVFIIIMTIFSVLGGLDRIFGDKLGLGREFTTGFHFFGNVALSMIGMLVLAPVIGQWLSPVMDFFADVFKLDPSIIPACIFSNDMGGAPLAMEVTRSEGMGYFNGLVVSSMMGCTISYTIPYAINVVHKDKQDDMFKGFLCGIATIPVGCIVSGLILRLPFGALMWNMVPLLIFSLIVVLGILFFPKKLVTALKGFAVFIKGMITFGLLLAIVDFLLGIQILKGLGSLSESALICFNAVVVLSGAFPFIKVLSVVLKKPLAFVSKKLGINKISTIGLISTIASSTTTFELMNKMDRKGVVLNSALAVSAAFTLGGALAFTMAFNEDYITAVTIAKLVSGFAGFVVSILLYNVLVKDKTENNESVETQSAQE